MGATTIWIRRILGYGCLCASLLLCCQAAGFSSLNREDRAPAFLFNNAMGAGMNLGNVFDAPDGEGTWWHGIAERRFFHDFRAAGFHHVRIPVTWWKHQDAQPPFRVDPVWMSRVHQVVDWANQEGLIVVLNTHHEDWFKANPLQNTKRFFALWKQIATEFRSIPEDKLALEVINESDSAHIDAAQTNDLNASVLNVIRNVSKNRIVILGAVGENGPRLAAGELAVPNDRFVIATYHCYDPWFFVSADPKTDADRTWGAPSQKADYLKLMDGVAAWSKKLQVPVYLGEFGTSARCEPSSRKNYYQFVSAEARARGFSYAIWDEGGDMVLYHREKGSWNDDVLSSIKR